MRMTICSPKFRAIFYFSASLLSVLACANTSFAEDTSADNRKNRTAYAALEPIGLTLMPVNGLRGGYFFTPDIIGELSIATGSASAGGEKYVKNLFEAKGKWFFTNSLYGDAGFAYEHWTAKYKVEETSTSSKTLKGTAANTGLSLHVGNQWQMASGFTIGCDWVGFFLSLNTSTDFKDDSSVNQDNKKSQEDIVEKWLGGNSFHLTRLYAGWTF